MLTDLGERINVVRTMENLYIENQREGNDEKPNEWGAILWSLKIYYS